MRKHMEERRATDDFCLKSDRDEEELMRTYSSLRRGVLSVLAVLVASLTLGAGAVSAAEPVHVKLTFGPDTFDAPAGTLGFCDFDYHEESSGTVNIKRFFDKDGNLVRVEAQVDLFVLHRNVDTGLTLTERVRFAAHIDLVTGERTVTGQNWHLRDENGRLVLSGAGLVGIDLIAGEIIKETPHFKADFAQTNCTALGGAPAT